MFKFGTSGIRDLTTNLLKENVAAKLAKHLNKMGWQEVSIGRDGRTGSAELLAEFTANFQGTIKNLGITTTPEIAHQPALAIMITASHNPSQYCGFKIYLNHQEQNTADIPVTPIYNKFLNLPKDIVIDCANGGLGQKLESLGFTNLINTDGEINKDCGATHPENITAHCQKNHLPIGFAVDGDADRFLIYLGDRVLASEEVAFLIAKLSGIKRLVIDETVNSALDKHFAVTRCAVGGHAVISAMRENNITFGAEKSGHYYFDTKVATSDALDAILLLTKGYRELGVPGLQNLLKQYQPYYQCNKNIKLADLPANYETVINEFKLAKGVRKVIRKSGTEPLLRIMLEGKTQKIVENEFARLINALS